ncbi:plasmid mobilization relaxosome protein MobC [Mucilaginibacter sp. SMC90]|uniref:plasmid mobilization protein n=1 Tax=Mucilaginibacter sp. SMC90 TaxID=2929803 RepID=UPI001FB42F87|nr:plasmid mobilization relaxosome protein MobC [Mucilaginibacter sp. SMC90]UOE47838.1 plasmid mobilization relaxosome protein MobC [Mucilaginibacter sp. SMC90]
MDDRKKLKGRPLLKEGRRSKKIDVRFSEEEYAQVLELEKQLGIAKADLVRLRVLKDVGKTVINARELIAKLDQIGNELARAGNNINQLARYGNIMQLKEVLDPQVARRFNDLLDQYIEMQHTLEIAIRKIIRLMGR